MGTVLGLALAFTIPLLFLAIIHKFDFYQTGQFRYILLCFAWGGIAYFLAVLTNRTIVRFGLADWETIIRFGAPIIEEILKALFLLYLVRRPQFTYSVDGAVYGFASGIGFAVFENYEYVTSTPELALAVALQRVFSTNLIHGSSSAIMGITLGVFRLETSGSRWFILLSGLGLAIGQHMLGMENTVEREECERERQEQPLGAELFFDGESSQGARLRPPPRIGHPPPSKFRNCLPRNSGIRPEGP